MNGWFEKNTNGKPRVSAMPYLYDIAEGNVPNHTPWSKLDVCPATGAGPEFDLWGGTGAISYPASAMQLEVVSSSGNDIGSINFSGTSTGGSTTSLTDTGKDFTAGTPVVIGDVVLLDTTLCEYGYVTGVTANTLTVAGGFSGGGTGSGVAYRIVDISAGGTGAQVVRIIGLNASLVEQCEFVVMNGVAEVPTASSTIYRVNAFIVTVVGSGGVAAGNISLRHLTNTPVYSYITLGFTRSRNIAYTIPAGKAVYVIQIDFSYGYSTNQTHYARLYTRAKQEPNGFISRVFYPYTDVVLSNSGIFVPLLTPTRLASGVDIKVSGTSTFSGAATVVLRGWIEDSD